MRDPQSHGKSRGTIFTSFKHPFLNDPRGVAGLTGHCSRQLFFVRGVHCTTQCSAAHHDKCEFFKPLIALCAREAAAWVALNVCSRSFPDQKWIRAGSGLAGRRWACL